MTGLTLKRVTTLSDRLTATKAGDDNYNGPVTSVARSVTLVKADQQSPSAPPVPSSAGLRNSDSTHAPCRRTASVARTRRGRNARAPSRGPARRTSGSPGIPARRTRAGARPPDPRVPPTRETSPSARERRCGGCRARSRGVRTWRLGKPCLVGTANAQAGGIDNVIRAAHHGGAC